MDRRKVLVVEDEPDIAALLVHLLQEEGYLVRRAPNGEVALEMLSAQPVDLIVTDLMMPVMSGLDLLRAIQASPELASIPTLVLSAVHEEHVRNSLPDLGPFLQKPFRVKQLLDTVGSLLGLQA